MEPKALLPKQLILINQCHWNIFKKKYKKPNIDISFVFLFEKEIYY
jgi:hypothetical protein